VLIKTYLSINKKEKVPELSSGALHQKKKPITYKFKPYTGQTENENPDLLKATPVLKELCSALVNDPTNQSFGYYIYTDRYHTSPQLADKLLGLNIVTTGHPEILKERKEKNRENEARGCVFRKNDRLL
jgi:hypothetical protein